MPFHARAGRRALLCVALLAAAVSDGAAAAEVSLDLTHYDRTVYVQEPVRYELAVTNVAVDPAIDVHLWFRHTSPRVLKAEGDGWSCTNHPQDGWTDTECIRQSLDAGGSTDVSVVIEAMADPGSFAPAIWVNALNDPTNSYQNPTTDVLAAPSPPPPVDLGVTAVYANPVYAREHVSYGLSVDNHGATHARGVSLTFQAPDGTRVLSASGEQWSCTVAYDGAACAMDGLLAALETSALTVVLEASAWPGEMTPTIRVTAANPDYNPENDVLYAATTVHERFVDLAVAVADSADSVGAGAEYSYTVTVRNESTIPTNSVSAGLHVPEGVDLLAVESAGWTCNNGVQDVYCWCEDWLAPGEAVNLVARVRAPAQAAEVTARAEAGSFWYADPALDNNVAYETTTVSSCGAGSYTSDPTLPEYEAHMPAGRHVRVVVDDGKCVRIEEQIKLY